MVLQMYAGCLDASGWTARHLGLSATLAAAVRRPISKPSAPIFRSRLVLKEEMIRLLDSSVFLTFGKLLSWSSLLTNFFPNISSYKFKMGG